MIVDQNKRDRIALGLDPDHVFVLFSRRTVNGAKKWRRYGSYEFHQLRHAQAELARLQERNPDGVYSVRRQKF